MVGSGSISGLLGLIGSIFGLSFVLDISDIARVGISNAVSDDLGTAIRKSHAVLASGSITITVFIVAKVGTRVFISNTVVVSVDSRAIIFRLSMVSGSVMRGRLVSGGRGRVVRSGSRVGNVNGFVDNRGGVVDGSGLVSGSGVVDRGRFVSRGRVVDGSGVVRSSSMVLGGVDGDVGGGMDSSDILLLIVVLVNLIGGGSGLAGNMGVVRTMRFVDGGSDSRGVTVLDALVAVLVGNSQSQEGGKSDEGLENKGI